MSLKFKLWRGLIAVVLPIALCLLPAARSQATAKSGWIEGTVVDQSGAVLPGAQVKVSPSDTIGKTDEQGNYRVDAIPAGQYTLTVSYIGFKPVAKPVTVVDGQAAKLDVTLPAASATEDILVEAERPRGEAEAINEVRTADNIVSVMPAEVIRSLPNANVADAIGRLPGVTLYRIEGEGVYIQVRGTEPRLTNVTVDGITIPAPEPTVRQVRLDVIPADMVDSIQLNKTLQANMDGNGIGGSVNLVTKEAGEQPTINLYGDGGYTNIMNGRGSYDFGGTVGKRFGATKRFGIVGNAVFDWNGRGIDNIQPALDPLSTFSTPFYDNNTIREYRYYRTRYGFDGSADYRLTNKTTLYSHAFYSDLKDWGDKWYYEPVSTGETCTAYTAGTCTGTVNQPASTSTAAPKFYTSSKRPNASVGTIILGGRTTHDNSLFLYQISASRSYEVDSAGNPKADFSWVPAKLDCTYNPSAQTSLYRPHFAGCDDTDTSPLLNAANWQFKDITIPKGINAQLNLTAQTSYARAFRLFNHSSEFEAGFKFTNAHQSQDSTENVYDSFPSTAPLMSALLGDFNNTDYFNGSYFGGHYGPVANMIAAETYTLANFQGNLDQQKTAADTYPNLFHTVEQITAGYMMDTVDFGKLHAQLGLRIENTRDLTFGYNLTFFGTLNTTTGVYSGGSSSVECPGNKNPTPPQAGNCYTAIGTNNNPSYIDLLPSMQLRYSTTPNSAVRLVYSRGVARPDPYQLVPYLTEDSTASPITVAIGNPSLRPEHANNYDLLYEAYLRPLGLLQAGMFFKQLNAPQVETIIPGSAGLPTGYFPPATQSVIAEYPGDSITQYINAQNAYIYGFETSFQQHFTYLPSVFKYLGVSANYSYTASREKGLPLRSDHPSTIDQSPNTWKVSPTYDTKHFSARVGLAYDQKSLFSYNYVNPAFLPSTGTKADVDPLNQGPSGPEGDIYTLTHFQVDAQASYRIWKGISAVVSGLNLNNEVFGYYQGSTQFVNQREFYKPTYSGGLRYNFVHHD
jgi:TonB-dependent receptor